MEKNAEKYYMVRIEEYDSDDSIINEIQILKGAVLERKNKVYTNHDTCEPEEIVFVKVKVSEMFSASSVSKYLKYKGFTARQDRLVEIPEATYNTLKESVLKVMKLVGCFKLTTDAIFYSKQN